MKLSVPSTSSQAKKSWSVRSRFSLLVSLRLPRRRQLPQLVAEKALVVGRVGGGTLVVDAAVAAVVVDVVHEVAVP